MRERIFSAPGFKPGRSQSIVELVDIYPTLCELTGKPIPNSVEGKSLVPILNDPKASVKDAAKSFTRNGTGLRTAKFAYMRYKDGSEELYDMDADPQQFTNLARKPDADRNKILDAMRKRVPLTNKRSKK